MGQVIGIIALHHVLVQHAGNIQPCQHIRVFGADLLHAVQHIAQRVIRVASQPGAGGFFLHRVGGRFASVPALDGLRLWRGKHLRRGRGGKGFPGGQQIYLHARLLQRLSLLLLIGLTHLRHFPFVGGKAHKDLSPGDEAEQQHDGHGGNGRHPSPENRRFGRLFLRRFGRFLRFLRRSGLLGKGTMGRRAARFGFLRLHAGIKTVVFYRRGMVRLAGLKRRFRGGSLSARIPRSFFRIRSGGKEGLICRWLLHPPAKRRQTTANKGLVEAVQRRGAFFRGTLLRGRQHVLLKGIKHWRGRFRNRLLL